MCTQVQPGTGAHLPLGEQPSHRPEELRAGAGGPRKELGVKGVKGAQGRGLTGSHAARSPAVAGTPQFLTETPRFSRPSWGGSQDTWGAPPPAAAAEGAQAPGSMWGAPATCGCSPGKAQPPALPTGRAHGRAPACRGRPWGGRSGPRAARAEKEDLCFRGGWKACWHRGPSPCPQAACGHSPSGHSVSLGLGVAPDDGSRVPWPERSKTGAP